MSEDQLDLILNALDQIASKISAQTMAIDKQTEAQEKINTSLKGIEKILQIIARDMS